MRWKTALNAFAITFADRMPGSEANPPNEDAAYTVDLTDPARPASSLVLLKLVPVACVSRQ
jgi:hypothetical protein